MKYKIKYVGKIEWFIEADITDDSNPYPEAEKLGQELRVEDGFVDQAYIEAAEIKPIQDPKEKEQ